jgi:hypothetical protein
MRLFCTILVAMLAAGCGGSGGDLGSLPSGESGGTSLTTAPLRIWVTDAPFPFDFVESASVVIREVQVRDRDRDRWEVVFSGESEIDLVPLSNGVEMLLVEASPPVGVYDEIRMIVDAGEVVLDSDAYVQHDDYVFNTENGRLHFPSGAQTGIKVKVENEVVVQTALSSDLVLDFDLTRNFVFNGPVAHAPGVKRVIFTPVVRAINASTAGSMAVTVWSDNVTPDDTTDDFAIENATFRILDQDANTVATQSTGADGSAVLSVPPATYDVEIEASGHTSASRADVQVFLANLTDLGDIVLVAAGEIGGVVMSDGVMASDDFDDVVVAGATVELRLAGETGAPLATTTTDANGMWRFDDLEAGDYDIAVTATGFSAGALGDVTAELTTPGYTILLEALPRDVTGTVTVPDGVDVTSVTIDVENAAGVTVATTAPDAQGDYTVELVTGDYEIIFDDGTATQTVEVSLVGASPKPTPEVVDVTFE